MSLSIQEPEAGWSIGKIGVVGPGIVGMPMAALLADARVKEGAASAAPVVVVQRPSPTSGWKVEAINAGRSPIGGVEPDLERIVAETAREGLLRASHDYAALRDADVILICVQTDKAGLAPDYGPLFEALHPIAAALRERPRGNVPLLVFESTLAPSSMTTLIREHFAGYGLQEGRDVLLGNSPNRVMPGRLVERVAAADKLAGGLSPVTPQLIGRLYRRIVTRGRIHLTNSLTAEVVKTLENAYRDVRIAFAAELVRYCDANDIDFYRLREEVNASLAQTDAASDDPTAVPSGGLLVPTVGVGGHCLPKDGILLWWRRIESGSDTSDSLILEARRVNDESPGETLSLAQRHFGDLTDRHVALLGAAYRFDSEDTRNSPTLVLARQLLDKGCCVTIHDPYVRPGDQNLVRLGLQERFSNDLARAVEGADVVIVCAAHRVYVEGRRDVESLAARARGLVDACNAYRQSDFTASRLAYAGIGRGRLAPPPDFVGFTHDAFRAMERGLARELRGLIGFLNQRYADAEFARVDFGEVQRLAATCATGCAIVDPEPVDRVAPYRGFLPRLVVSARSAA